MTPPVCLRNRMETDGCFFASVRRKGGAGMKLVVVSPPKALAGLLRRVFHIGS